MLSLAYISKLCREDYIERELAPGIVTDPEILGGRPILKGHRIAVSQLLGQISGGITVDEVRDDYELTEAEMLAVLRYATQAVEEIERDLTHAQPA